MNLMKISKKSTQSTEELFKYLPFLPPSKSFTTKQKIFYFKISEVMNILLMYLILFLYCWCSQCCDSNIILFASFYSFDCDRKNKNRKKKVSSIFVYLILMVNISSFLYTPLEKKRLSWYSLFWRHLCMQEVRVYQSLITSI